MVTTSTNTSTTTTTFQPILQVIGMNDDDCSFVISNPTSGAGKQSNKQWVRLILYEMKYTFWMVIVLICGSNILF